MKTLIKFLFYGLAFIAASLFLIYHLTNSYVDEQLSEMSPDEKEQFEKELEESQRLARCMTSKLGEARRTITQNLKDPDSYKQTGYNFNKNTLELNYSATNSFGGRMSSTLRFVYEPDICGELVDTSEVK